MEELKNWGLLMLFVSAGSLIYCFLLPSGSVSRIAKAVISITVMVAVFLPLFDVFESFSDLDFSFGTPPESEDFGDYFEEQGKAAVEAIIKDTVRKFTNVPYKTEIFIDKTDDMSINIEYVGITFSAKPEFEKEMRDALFEALGIIPDIRVEYVIE